MASPPRGRSSSSCSADLRMQGLSKDGEDAYVDR